MQKARAEIETELGKLQSNDFHYRNQAAVGMERLHVLLPELVAVAAPQDAILTILKLIERLSNTPDLDDCELGNPGPMVHELEKLGGHEAQLIESVTRLPTPLTIWMVNRLMNALAKGDERWTRLLEVLKRSAAAATAAPGAREQAKDFILHQESR